MPQTQNQSKSLDTFHELELIVDRCRMSNEALRRTGQIICFAVCGEAAIRLQTIKVARGAAVALAALGSEAALG